MVPQFERVLARHGIDGPFHALHLPERHVDPDIFQDVRQLAEKRGDERQQPPVAAKAHVLQRIEREVKREAGIARSGDGIHSPTVRGVLPVVQGRPFCIILTIVWAIRSEP